MKEDFGANIRDKKEDFDSSDFCLKNLNTKNKPIWDWCFLWRIHKYEGRILLKAIAFTTDEFPLRFYSLQKK